MFYIPRYRIWAGVLGVVLLALWSVKGRPTANEENEVEHVVLEIDEDVATRDSHQHDRQGDPQINPQQQPLTIEDDCVLRILFENIPDKAIVEICRASRLVHQHCQLLGENDGRPRIVDELQTIGQHFHSLFQTIEKERRCFGWRYRRCAGTEADKKMRLEHFNLAQAVRDIRKLVEIISSTEAKWYSNKSAWSMVDQLLSEQQTESPLLHHKPLIGARLRNHCNNVFHTLKKELREGDFWQAKQIFENPIYCKPLIDKLLRVIFGGLPLEKRIERLVALSQIHQSTFYPRSLSSRVKAHRYGSYIQWESVPQMEEEENVRDFSLLRDYSEVLERSIGCSPNLFYSAQQVSDAVRSCWSPGLLITIRNAFGIGFKRVQYNQTTT
jgi:hypothetical protein